MMSFAPLQLLKMEFRLEEVMFQEYLTEINKELSAQQAALDRGADFAQLTTRSQEFFKDGNTLKG